jgi:hypothetical protein
MCLFGMDQLGLRRTGSFVYLDKSGTLPTFYLPSKEFKRAPMSTVLMSRGSR